MSIREAEVVEAALLLPETSFIRNYIAYAYHCTDSPLHYHLGGALCALAAIAPVDLALKDSAARMTYAPFWTMIIGDSGEARKTTAIKLARSLLAGSGTNNGAVTTLEQEDAGKMDGTVGLDPSRVSLAPGSAEGLIASLQVQPTQLLTYEEFGSFLAQTSEGRYLAPLRELFTQAYDCSPLTRQLVKKRIEVANPRLSLLAGTTPTYLEEWTTDRDWTGGFLSRWFCLLHTGPRERDYAVVPGGAHLRAKIVTLYGDRYDRKTGPYIGMDAGASELWNWWYKDVANRFPPEGITRRARGAAIRTPEVARKVALLAAYDLGHARTGGPWRLPIEAVNFGISLAEMHLRCVIAIQDRLAASKFGRERRVVLDAVGQEPRTMGDILRRCSPAMDMRDVTRVLETLVASGDVLRSDGAERVWVHHEVADQFDIGGDYVDPFADHGTSNVIPMKP